MTQLYLISPPSIEISAFQAQLSQAFTAAADTKNTDGEPLISVFQLRLKNADDAQITEAARALLPICRQHDVAFILNDRLDLCIDLGCDGLHVGQEDLATIMQREQLTSAEDGDTKPAIAWLRAQLGDDVALGVTCHASKHLAMEAADAGADYVAFGAFYPTTSKPQEKLDKWGTPTPDILEWWTTHTEVPCVAIGGITPQNCQPLVAAGADFLAAINAVWHQPGEERSAVEAFASAFNHLQ